MIHHVCFDLKDTKPVGIAELGGKIIAELGLTVVGYDSHSYQPHGETHVWILAESHLVIATWPENGEMYIDIVTCQRIPDEKMVSISDLVREVGGGVFFFRDRAPKMTPVVQGIFASEVCSSSE